MKTWSVTLMIALVLILALVLATPAFAAGTQGQTANVPKYDPTKEAKYKGVVEEVKNHQCPVSGGMGAHLMLKLADGKVVEVHLATTKFIEDYEVAFSKGDEIEVLGVMVKFEDADALFAREIKKGNDTFVFRDKEGKPVW
jgi:hypothetical protein